MKKSLYKNQQGIAHLAIIALAVIVLGAIGFAGWRVMQNKDTTSKNATSNSESTSSNTQIADIKQLESECNKELDDKDLCRFFSTWTGSEKYALTSTGNEGGTETKSTFIVDGNKSYMKIEGEVTYETLTIDSTYYTKAGATWYKQANTTPTDTPDSTTPSADELDYDVPTTEELKADKTVYEKLGKEACGNETCFKYKWSDPADSGGAVNYVWFDDKDYLIRKMRIESANGVYSEQVYTYDNVVMPEPSPVVELGPNQYIIPGQSEPVDMSTYMQSVQDGTQ